MFYDVCPYCGARLRPGERCRRCMKGGPFGRRAEQKAGVPEDKPAGRKRETGGFGAAKAPGGRAEKRAAAAQQVVLACLLLLGAMLLILCGAVWKEDAAPVWQEELYVVRQGDTLFGLAAERGIEDWRTWSELVRRMNGLSGAGLTAGESIVVFTEADRK